MYAHLVLIQSQNVETYGNSIHAIIHDALERKEYAGIDFLLMTLSTRRMAVELIKGILKITAPWKEHLQHRKTFYADASLTLSMLFSEDYAKELLRGLE